MIRANNLLRAGLAPLPFAVANNAAKLALTDLLTGFSVRITGEANRVEMYLGNVAPTRSGVTVSGAGAPDVNGVYYRSDFFYSGKPVYTKAGKVPGDYASSCISWYPDSGSGQWAIFNEAGDLVYILDEEGVPYPFAGTTPWSDLDYGPAPSTVAENVFANDANWRILGVNTVYLVVKNEAGGGPWVVEGISVAPNETRGIGWFPVDQPIHTVPVSPDTWVSLNSITPNLIYNNLGGPPSVNASEGGETIYLPALPRACEVSIGLRAL